MVPSAGRQADRARSGSLPQAGSAGEIDRDKLRDPALGHRHPEQPVDAGHRDAVVCDDQKTGASGVGDLTDETAEPVDIGIVERGINFVQDANRRGVRQKHREDQRERSQRLFATG